MNDQVKTEQPNEVHISPSVLNDGFGVTDEMVDKFLNFAARSSFLQHPEVPYHGTANGDSKEQWLRRYTKAALEAALSPNVEFRGGGAEAVEQQAKAYVPPSAGTQG